MQETDLEAMIRAYLQCYDQRDLAGCMGFFAEDATIHFAMGTYRGPQAIEEWHEDRFKADLRVIRVDEIVTQGDTVTVDAVVTSKVAKAWRFDSVAGRVDVIFEGDKIKEATFGLRTTLPFEGW